MNPFSLSVKELEQKARAIRRRIIVLNAESPAGGHTGADLSQVELLTALYFRILNCSPARKESDDRDIYIQSKGHAVGGYYCVLAEAGFIPVDWLATYQHADSALPGHPVKHKTPGIELNTGALGHGLPVAVGIALAAKRDNNPRRVFVVTGDGELAEGSNWEAAMAAAQYGLDNLCLVIDRNRLQISGTTEQVMAHENMAERLSSFGWHTVTCRGNDYESLAAAFDEARGTRGRPTAILAQTVKGCGISFMEDQVGWHHRVPTEDEYQQAMQELEVKAHGLCQ
ncbi:MAG: transketolase [Clostridiales bacterium]|nr:transketolase [Clostridiales bacterium]